MRAIPFVALTSLTLLAAACSDRIRVQPQVDAGPVCLEGEHLVDGACRFVCNRDAECQVGQRCNLFTGSCEAKPPEADAGPAHLPCTEGATRCSPDNHAVQSCGLDGTWTVQKACPPPDGFCMNEACLVCRPGSSRCTANGGGVEICKDDGSGYRTVTCAPSASCVANECRECNPGQKRCSPDNKSMQECQHGAAESLAWAFVNAGDNFDGTCITQACESSSSGAPQCHPPACVPGSTQCLSAAVQQVCSGTGGWQNTTCASVPGLGPTSECVSGACVDECGDAAKAKSYFGCEYWGVVMDNPVSAKFFKGNTLSGQGTSDSEFAFVVTNRSAVATTVTVTRYMGSALQTVKTVSVPPRQDPATKGLLVIRLPWQSIGADPYGPGSSAPSYSVTGKARYGYHLTSNHPISVYQFNPLAAFKAAYSCTTDDDCAYAEPREPGPKCQQNQCNYFSYSNDASLLLPAHILGTAYVGLTAEHIMVRDTSNSGAASIDSNGMLTIVGTADGTQVTVKSTAQTLSGGSIAAMVKGTTRVFTLNSYEVLQIASDNPVNAASTSSNLECGDNPFDRPDCGGWSWPMPPPCTKLCRTDSDLTGSIITSDKPIAVFGGSSCTLRGYLDPACDHVEEQLFPFATWGKHFVATRTAPLRLTSGSFASPANAGPDYYKIVAGCPNSAAGTPCPSGTAITLSPAPAAADVLSPNRCLSGSVSANNCKVAGGTFVEFRSKTSFVIDSDQPIQAAQQFAGQDATTGVDRPSQGDPSLVLLPPVEQWRNNYTVLTAPGIKDNYLGIVYDSTKVDAVVVNGATVSSSTFKPVGATPYRVANIPVPIGTHTITVNSKPGISPIPGAGVTVYGFDKYVSYGYTGGLDLTTIVTGINPGG